MKATGVADVNCRALLCVAAILGSVAHGQLAWGDTPIVPGDRSIDVDTRSFELARQNSRSGYVGCLWLGGYCHRGAVESEYSYHVVDTKPRSATVEVVSHSPDYQYVRHDLAGALFAVANGKEDQAGLAVRGRGSAGVKLIGWRSGGGGSSVIAVVATPPKPKAGMVAWYSANAASNGLTTVVIGYPELDGLPKQLIDEFLARYPSAINERSFLVGDWVDDDLKKWADILGSEPDDEVILGIASRNIAQYERDARERAQNEGVVWEPWNALELRPSHGDSEQFRRRIGALRVRLERWRVDRKQGH